MVAALRLTPSAWTAPLTVASLTLLGALLTPLLLEASGGPAGIIFPYLILVNLGSAVVGVRRQWHLLTLTGFLGTAILVARWWFGHYTLEQLPEALEAIGSRATWGKLVVHP